MHYEVFTVGFGSVVISDNPPQGNRKLEERTSVQNLNCMLTK